MATDNENLPSLFLKQPPRLMGLDNYFVQPSSDDNGNATIPTDFSPILKEVYNLRETTQSQFVQFRKDVLVTVEDIQEELVTIRKATVEINNTLKKNAKEQRIFQEELLDKQKRLADRLQKQTEQTTKSSSSFRPSRGMRGVKNVLGGTTGTILEGVLDTLFPGLGRAGLTKKVVGAFGKTLGFVGMFFGNTLQKVWSGNLLKSVTKSVGNFFNKTFKSFKTTGKGVFEFLLGTGKSSVGTIGKAIGAGFKAIGSGLKSLLWRSGKTHQADVLDSQGNVTGQTTATESGGLTKTGMVVAGIAGTTALLAGGFALWKALKNNSEEQKDILEKSSETLEKSKDIQGEQLDGLKNAPWWQKPFIGDDSKPEEQGDSWLVKAGRFIKDVNLNTPLGGMLWLGQQNTENKVAHENAKQYKPYFLTGHPEPSAKMKDIISSSSIIDGGNSLPYVAMRNAQTLANLDTTLHSWGYTPIYTSAMGGKGEHKVGSGHFKGNKVDVQFKDASGKFVRLTRAQEAYLRKQGYMGNGAVGWEERRGQIAHYDKETGRYYQGHYDFNIALNGLSGAVTKTTGTITEMGKAVVDATSAFGGDFIEHLKKASQMTIQNADPNYKDPLLEGYKGIKGAGASSHLTEMETKAILDSAGKPFNPNQYSTQEMRAQQYPEPKTQFNSGGASLPQGVDMTMLEFLQLQFQS